MEKSKKKDNTSGGKKGTTAPQTAPQNELPQQLQVNTAPSHLLWVETNAGDYIAVRNYDSGISADNKDDEKLLNDIDWKKLGFTKSGLTLLNGAQAADVKERQLKQGDYAYHKPTNQYVKLDKFVAPQTPAKQNEEDQ